MNAFHGSIVPIPNKSSIVYTVLYLKMKMIIKVTVMYNAKQLPIIWSLYRWIHDELEFYKMTREHPRADYTSIVPGLFILDITT